MNWQRLWLGLIVAGSLLILALAPLPITDSDGALLGVISRNVVESGEWLTLRYHAGWIVDKPPLTFWLMALSLLALGDSVVALRGWQLVMTLLLALATYRIARLRGLNVDQPRNLAKTVTVE